MLMAPTRSLSSIPKPHGLLQRDLQWIHPLSGFTCANPIIIDESFDANYKLFKNQNGEVFPRYIGTKCRNGPPMKKI